MTARLNVNIDHVATIREARKTIEPSVLEAARICESAGAHGITVHIRSDRRHIQDRDIEELRKNVTTYLNVEMAATDEMVAFALRVKPDAVSLVPESPNEVTTEGGLDVVGNLETVAKATGLIRSAGTIVSIFIDPDLDQINATKQAGAQQIELCTAEYAEQTLKRTDATAELKRLESAADHAKDIGLIVAAGHGLTTTNVKALATMPAIEEFNIGHHIISRAVFIGLENAVKEMLGAVGR